MFNRAAHKLRTGRLQAKDSAAANRSIKRDIAVPNRYIVGVRVVNRTAVLVCIVP